MVGHQLILHAIALDKGVGAAVGLGAVVAIALGNGTHRGCGAEAQLGLCGVGLTRLAGLGVAAVGGVVDGRVGALAGDGGLDGIGTHGVHIAFRTDDRLLNHVDGQGHHVVHRLHVVVIVLAIADGIKHELADGGLAAEGLDGHGVVDRDGRAVVHLKVLHVAGLVPDGGTGVIIAADAHGLRLLIGGILAVSGIKLWDVNPQEVDGHHLPSHLLVPIDHAVDVIATISLAGEPAG